MSSDTISRLVWHTSSVLREGKFKMSTTQYLPEEELIERALQALMEALGPVEAIRFLTLPRLQRLESVKCHRQWQATLNQEQFFDQLFGPQPTDS
jgi:hypothetical protein